jgi:hypothetical protein
MAIKQFITLEGAEDVVANLKKISDAGEQALAKFKESGQQFIPANFTAGLQGAQQATAGLSRSTNELSTAYHLLHPILQEVGISISEFRSFAVLANEGIAGLAVAVGGALVIGATNAADKMANLQRSMAFLFGAQGKAAVDSLGKGLEGLGASAETLAPALTSAEQVLQRISAFKGIDLSGKVTFGSPQQQEQVTAAIANLEKQLEVLGETSAQASPKVNSLFDVLNRFDPKTGKNLGLTADAFEQLRRTVPEVAQIVGDAIEKNLGGNIFERLRQGPISFLEVLRALAAVKITDPIPTTVAKSFEDLKKSGEALLASLGEAGLSKIFDDAAASVRSLKTEFDLFAKTDEFAGIKKGATDAATELNNLNTVAQATGKAIHDALTASFVKPAADQQGIGIFEAIITNLQQTLDGIHIPDFLRPLVDYARIDFGLVADAFNELHQTIAGVTWAGVFDGLLSAAQTVFQAIQTAWQALVSFVSQNQPQFQSPGGGSSSFSEFAPGGAAGGGHIRGAGTSTSDSILAWLSNNEFVMRSAAVSHYGVGFMQAINSMRLPKDFFRSFNLGGLVLPPFPSPPRFAQGGLATAGDQALRPVNIFFDRQKFALAGSGDEVERLVKASVFEQLAAGGRSPSWRRS